MRFLLGACTGLAAWNVILAAIIFVRGHAVADFVFQYTCLVDFAAVMFLAVRRAS